MKKTNTYKWVFTSRFRTNAYGWKASKLACRRIREAVSEIKKVARKDPVLGAEGSISFMEKLWPALQLIQIPLRMEKENCRKYPKSKKHALTTGCQGFKDQN